MGVMTLADFRDELSENLDWKSGGNTRLDRWINAAVVFIRNQYDFEAVRVVQAIPTVVNQVSYAAPVDIEGIEALRNITATNPKNLIRDENFWALDPAAVSDEPVRWTLRGSSIYLWPKPNAVYSLELWYTKSITRLTAVGNVTQFPAVWDQAVVYYSTYLGKMSMIGAEAAMPWYVAYKGYTEKIRLEGELRNTSVAAPVWIPQSLEEMGELHQ